MYLGDSVGVVVPAYNEERHVRTVVETLPDIVDRAYVVDDGSSDGTWREIERSVRDRAGCRVASATGGDRPAPTPDGGANGGTLDLVEIQPSGARNRGDRTKGSRPADRGRADAAGEPRSGPAHLHYRAADGGPPAPGSPGRRSRTGSRA